MQTAAPGQILRFPELSFYYGLSLAELATMPRNLLKLYITRLPGLVAERQLAAIEASLMQNYNESALESRIQELEDTIAQTEEAPPELELSREMMELKLASLGIGVTFTDGENGG